MNKKLTFSLFLLTVFISNATAALDLIHLKGYEDAVVK
jgi:hypothetical protein